MATDKPKYTVCVGNVGLVYGGNNAATATAAFRTYKSLSSRGVGRAANETVTLIDQYGMTIKEFNPKKEEDEQ